MSRTHGIVMVSGPEIAAYGFPGGHPFGPDRHDAFVAELEMSSSWSSVDHLSPRQATRDELESFHTAHHVDRVIELSRRGEGYLDGGDTPAYPGVFEAASHVVGASLVALDAIMTGETPRAFVPIAGLHHARRDRAAGFCVFNDCAVAIEAARLVYGLAQVAYVDIDAHHGDGVFYGFEDDPGVIFADIHEDGRFLYPGTGRRDEIGRGAAEGTKLNIPMPPGADDALFREAWIEIEEFLTARPPDLIVLQCGADSLGGDPITHLAYTESAHASAAESLRRIADAHCGGRVLALGGGGYDRGNLARAWTRVVESLARLEAGNDVD